MITEKQTIGTIPALFFGAPSDRLFLYVHGKGSQKEEAEMLAREVVPRGYRVLSFDLPEHGDRKNDPRPCTVQNGVRDLQAVHEAVKDSCSSISLFACSLGAYFSLVAWRGVAFRKCIFLSPVLDMERLIRNMMQWTGVTEERLREEKEIPTPFGETLSWEYYEYVRAHPVDIWNSPTSILYGENDTLTERDVLDSFAKKFSCRVTVMKDGEHYFHTPDQLRFLENWLGEQDYQ